MGVEEDKKEKIVRLIQESAKDSKPSLINQKPERRVFHKTIRIGASTKGDGNIHIGGDANGTTNIFNGPVFVGADPGVAATAKESDDKKFISDSQAKALHRLKDRIIALEADPDKAEAAKNVWRTLNRAMDVEKMRQIPAEKFAHAKAYLGAWLARLEKEATLERITELKAEIAADIATESLAAKVRRYVSSHWPGQSLESLDSEDALGRVKRYLEVLSQ